ncbi:hypothetical protein [Actinopolymorpha pittospori]|uniref:Uncharacterized protein n=1 Tax=Actinopolymorpha pittospori TaxID=648752 RepID=A0A927MR48_9ACTN|nr:hypothetical protein [Actinopolymorpha pittospori]MBE1603698.1 hypothetical protein [Actinopolymorpha pittospori]
MDDDEIHANTGTEVDGLIDLFDELCHRRGGHGHEVPATDRATTKVELEPVAGWSGTGDGSGLAAFPLLRISR